MNNSSDDIFKDSEELEDKQSIYTALKAKFFAQERKIYGILLLIYSHNLDYCEKSFLVLTTYSLDYNALGANSSFEDFYKAIYNKTKEGISFQNINFKIRSSLETNLSLFEGDSKASKVKDVIEIEQDLKSIFKKAMSDKKVTIFTFLEKISREDYNNFFEIDVPQSEKTASTSTEDSSFIEDYEVNINKEINIPPNATLIPASLVLAPLEGKPISDLRQGHSIFVTTQPEESNDEKDSNEKPQTKSKHIERASVIGNFYYEGTHHIGVQIRDNEYAVLSEEANVKVKVSQAEKTESDKKNITIKHRRRSRLLILGSIFAIIVLISILFFSFIWFL